MTAQKFYVMAAKKEMDDLDNTDDEGGDEDDFDDASGDDDEW